MQPLNATLQAFSPDSPLESPLPGFGNTPDIEVAGSEIAAPLVTDTSLWNQESSLLVETQEANVMMTASAGASVAVSVIPMTVIPVVNPVIPVTVIPVVNPVLPLLPIIPELEVVRQAVDLLFRVVKSQNQDELLNNPVVRFSNQNVPGTHFYSASVDEVTNVILNYPQFQFEDVAFLVGIEPGDDLLAVHRFSNQSVPGTHFYTASEAEYQNVLVNYPQFKYDGIAYYVDDPALNLGADVYRFSNQQLPGTHFYTASQAEYQNVLANYPQFNYDGIAYEVNIL